MTMDIHTENKSGFKLWSDTVELIPNIDLVLARDGDKEAQKRIDDIVARNEGKRKLRESR
jgi:hypothetical protein